MVQYGSIRWGDHVAHSKGCNFQRNIGQSGGVFKGPTKMSNTFSALSVNPVG